MDDTALLLTRATGGDSLADKTNLLVAPEEKKPLQISKQQETLSGNSKVSYRPERE